MEALVSRPKMPLSNSGAHFDQSKVRTLIARRAFSPLESSKLLLAWWHCLQNEINSHLGDRPKSTQSIQPLSADRVAWTRGLFYQWHGEWMVDSLPDKGSGR